MKKQEVDININIAVSAGGTKISNGETHEYAAREKLKVSLSVAQLAYLFRVLSEIDVIRNKNISEVMRLISQNISTPKADNISFDSFKTKYYNPDYSTKQFCHDFMIKQLNFIRKDLKD